MPAEIFLGHAKSMRFRTSTHDPQRPAPSGESSSNATQRQPSRSNVPCYEDSNRHVRIVRYTSLGNPIPAPGEKIWCLEWLSVGRCAYNKTGCKYRHEIPEDRELLRALGLNDIRHWDTNGNGFRQNQSLPSRYDAGSQRRSSLQSVETGTTVTETDDQGNMPTPSLWIGNTPLDVKTQDLRRIFAEFGTIESVRVIAPLRYGFVNYSYTQSAVDAWRACHEKDIFNRGDRVYVRYTTREGASKDNTSTVRWSGGSFNDKTILAQRLSQETSDTIRTRGPQQQWPSREPPREPKSHRTPISPPQRRSFDVYRPERRTLDSYRPSRSKDIDPHELDRPKSPSSTVIRSDAEDDSAQLKSPLSLVEPESSPYSPRCSTPELTDALHQDEDHDHQSPLGMQIKGKAAQTSKQQVGTESPKVPDIMTAPSSNPTALDALTDLPQKGDTNDLQSAPLHHTLPIPTNEAANTAFTNLLGLWKSNDHGKVAVTPMKQCLESPRIDRVRAASGERASVTSETASTASSSLRTKCFTCKRLGGSLATLVPCSTCPRKFHMTCGIPPPSATPDRTKFQCSRCLENQRSLRDNRPTAKSVADSGGMVHSGERSDSADVIVDEMARSMARPTIEEEAILGEIGTDLQELDVAQEQQHRNMVSPNTGDTTPRISILEENVSETRVPRTETLNENTSLLQDEVSATNEQSQTAVQTPGKHGLGTTRVGIDTIPLAAVDAQQLGPDPRDVQHAHDMAARYKNVTCHWWTKSDCHRNSDECMFAHRKTNLLHPSTRKPCKDWTCPRHFTHYGCARAEEDCQYSHRDTGLYIGKDGHPWKKHLTCFWFATRGFCNKTEDQCLFAHKNTGIIAEDPSLAAPGPSSRQSMDSHVAQGFKGSFDPLPGADEGKMQAHSAQAQYQAKFVTSPVQVALSSATIPRADLSSKHKPQPQPLLVSNDFCDDPRQALAPTQEATLILDARRALGKLARTPASDAEANHSREKSGSTTEVVSPSVPAPTSSNSSNLKLTKCQGCGKTLLFTRNLCVLCQKSGKKIDEAPAASEQDKSLETPIDDLTLQAVEPPASFSDTEDPIDNVMDVDGTPTSPKQAEPSTGKVLKRKTSSTTMFLSSKRTKPSDSVAGSRQQNGPKVIVKNNKLMAGQPSLEQLSQAERAKKAQISASRTAGCIDRSQTTSNDDRLDEEVKMPRGALVAHGLSSRHDHHNIDWNESTKSILVQDTELDIHVSEDEANSEEVEEDNEALRKFQFTKKLSSTDTVARPESAWSLAPSYSSSMTHDSDVALADDTRMANTRFKDPAKRSSKWLRSTEDSPQYIRSLPALTQKLGNSQPLAKSCKCSKQKRICLHNANGEYDGRKCNDWLRAEAENGRKFTWPSRRVRESIEAAAQAWLHKCGASTENSLSQSVSSADVEDYFSVEQQDDLAAMSSRTEDDDDIDELATSEINEPKRARAIRSMEHDRLAKVVHSPVEKTRPLVANIATSPLKPGFSPSRSVAVAKSPRKANVTAVMAKMRLRGALFEPSDEEDDIPGVIPQFEDPPPRHRERPVTLTGDPQSTVKEPLLPRLTKGQALKNARLVYQRRMAYNMQYLGNAHVEVDRKREPVQVRALIERQVPNTNPYDRFAPPSVEQREEKITWKEFMGVPRDIELKLCTKRVGSTKSVAFREKEEVSEDAAALFASRNKKRDKDKEIWPVGAR